MNTMNDFQILFKNKKVIAGIIIAVALLMLVSIWISKIDFSKEDRKDYAKVGETFIRENGFIANKIGKVTQVSHIGKGGRTGKESYNVYRVRGTEDTGVCNLTISKDSNDDWYVTSADIAFSGKTLTVPIKRSDGEEIMKFDLN